MTSLPPLTGDGLPFAVTDKTILLAAYLRRRLTRTGCFLSNYLVCYTLSVHGGAYDTAGIACTFSAGIQVVI